MTGSEMAGLGLLAGGATISGVLLSKPATERLVWHRVRWPRTFTAVQVTGLLRTLAGDRRRFVIVFEIVGTAGHVSYRLGVPTIHAEAVTASLRSFIAGASTTVIKHAVTAMPTRAWGVRLTTRQRPLRVDNIDVTARAVVSALASVGPTETVFMQLVLGPRLHPHAVANQGVQAPIESLADVARTAFRGVQEIDGERRKALRDKLGEPGFRCALRVGVTSSNRDSRPAVVSRLVAALRTAEAPGIRLTLKRDDVMALATAQQPRRWPLALNVDEVALLSGWPIGDEALPGVDRSRSRLMPPDPSVARKGRIIGEGLFPGEERLIALDPVDALQHVHVLGPTGVGKSTLLLTSALQEIGAGRAVVVIDPKGDLVDDLLQRIPDDRLDDVVVLDPADESRPVGINPLHGAAGSAELVADQVLAVFHGLYKDNWGPRTQDILHACLLTLGGRPETTLCALPLLLSNPAYRKRVVAGVHDQIALIPFWVWFENLTEAERAAAIAPVMNKLRAFLLRPRMRAVIGQAEPCFNMIDVFTRRRILLVSLAKGQLGPEAAALLGSLIVAQLWQTALGRTAIAPERRHPVMVFIDEFQDYLHLPTDLADVLAQARGLGVSLTLAHQHLAQLSPGMRAAVLANARSRICFQLGSEDAGLMARTTTELDSEDFQGLERFQAYASLVAHGSVTPYTSIRTPAPPVPLRPAEVVRRLSRDRYGRDRAEVDNSIQALLTGDTAVDDDQPVGRRRRS